jgi:hypothetical protein
MTDNDVLVSNEWYEKKKPLREKYIGVVWIFF